MRRIFATIVLTASILTSVPTTTEAASGRCPQYESLLRYFAPRTGWDVTRMSAYAHRESRCTANVRSRTSDSGLLQINDVNLRYLSQRLGSPVTPWLLMNPAYNVWAAAELCMYARRAWGNCYAPWAT
jgi:soluble lytic murein transglycosylase-like protein